MILEGLKYIRSRGKAKEWAIEGRDGEVVHFGNINLLVGKNASGKSRTLAVIREIAGLLSGLNTLQETAHANALYHLYFKNHQFNYEYLLDVKDRKAIEEKIWIDGKLVLDRAANEIYPDGSLVPVKLNLEDNQLSTTIQDKEFYPFLTRLFEWGIVLKRTAFTNQFEKNFFLDDLDLLNDAKYVSSKKTASLLHAFCKGKELFGDGFIKRIKADMHALGYPIKLVDVLEHNSGYGIYVHEEELDEMTSQLEMSQGMFRALSFIIQLNFAIMSGIPLSILIDDLGEGLDFDRSKLLIDMLIKNINESNIQIFITTNDRYIMNKIPLKYWTVIERKPKKSIFYNYFNSKEVFEDFKYTGLSNVDFLATDFYVSGFGEDVQEQ